MNISYDWYKIFCSVAECGNITSAAEKLYISQPAVSQCIHQLEENIGCTLFVRGAKGVKLTSEGMVLYSYIAAGVASFNEGEQKLLSMLRFDAGEIKIGASDMTLEYFLLPYLEKFHKKYPNVKIAITNNPTPQTIELLQQRKIDFAAVSEPVVCAGFKPIPVRQIKDIFICGNNTEVKNGQRIFDLKDQLILLERCTSTRCFINNEFRKRGFTVAPRFELATSPQIVGFAKRNMGIGCVVSDFAQNDINNSTVREIQVSDPLPPRNICIVKNEKESSLAAKALLSIIIN